MMNGIALTELQKSYITGRGDQTYLGQSGMHDCREFHLDIAGTKLKNIGDTLAQRHDTMRMRIDSNSMTWAPEAHPKDLVIEHLYLNDAELSRTEWVEKIRDEIFHERLSLDGPLIRFHYVSRTQTLYDYDIVWLSVDSLATDAEGIAALMQEASLLYEEKELPDPPAPWTPPRRKPTEADLNFWEQTTQNLPAAPELPWKKSINGVTSSRFQRQSRKISREELQALDKGAVNNGLSLNSLLTAVVAESLARFTQNADFRLCLPTEFRQRMVDPVGPSSDFFFVGYRNLPNFLQRAVELQNGIYAGLGHRQVSGIHIARLLAAKEGSGTRKTVVITNGMNWGSPGTIRETNGIVQTPQVPMDIRLTKEDPECLTISIDFAEAAIEPEIVSRLLDTICKCAARLIELDDWAVHDVIALPEPLADLRPELLSSKWTPEDLHRAIYQNLWRGDSDKTVLVCGQNRYSREEFRRFVVAISWKIRQSGVNPGDRVVVLLPKGWEQPATALACFFLGVCMVPLDSGAPKTRLKDQIEAAQPSLIIDSSLLGWLAEEGSPIDVITENVVADDREDQYILFTSGSTGKPKGVRIKRSAVALTTGTTAQAWGISSKDRFFGITPFHHDMAVFDIFGCFAHGAQLILPTPEETRDATAWAHTVEAENVSTWVSVPAILEMLITVTRGAVEAPRISSLRLIATGGDWVRATLMNSLRDLIGQVRLISLGGPTETTMWNIWHEIEAGEISDPIAYGKPLAGNGYRILNAAHLPRPVGVPGRMYCIGDNLAAGYLDDSQTAATFPEMCVPGSTGTTRHFRTSDLGMITTDGEIQFVGRADGLLKIRGSRADAGEIEGAIRAVSGVSQCLVISLNDELIAGIVITESNQGFDLKSQSTAWKEDLSKTLPRDLIPTRWVALSSLPLTSNGKPDRANWRPNFEQGRSMKPRLNKGALTKIRELKRQRDGEPEKRTSPELSTTEARMWMLHQQNPLSASGPFLASCKLRGDINIPALRRALKAAIEYFPELRVSFDHDDEATAIKRTKPSPSDILHVDDEMNEPQQVLQELLRAQMKPMNLAEEQLVKISLHRISHREYLFAVLGHHIVMGDSAWRPLWEFVTSHYENTTYEGNPMGGIQNGSPAVDTSEQDLEFWKREFPEGIYPTLLPESWKLPSTVSDVGEAFYPELGALPQRIRLELGHSGVENLQTEIGVGELDGNLQKFAAVTSIFARDIATSLGLSEIVVAVPLSDPLNPPGFVGPSSNLGYLRLVDLGGSLSEIFTQVIEKVRNASANAHTPIEEVLSKLKTPGVTPDIIVVPVSDTFADLKLSGVDIDNHGLPPLTTGAPLTLAVQENHRGDGIIVEITTASTHNPSFAWDIAQKLGRLETVNSHEDPQEKVEDGVDTVTPSDAVNIVNEEIVDGIRAEFIKILGHPIEASADFFEEGGHSLTATKLVNQLNKAGFQVNIGDFFAAPTPQSLAQKISMQDTKAVKFNISQDSVLDKEDGLFAGQHHYLAEPSEPSSVFSIPLVMDLQGPVDIPALEAAIYDVVAHQEMLRLRMSSSTEAHSSVTQRILSMDELNAHCPDWYMLVTDKSAERLAWDELHRNFKIFDGQLFYARIHPMDSSHGGGALLTLVGHHLVLEEWSVGILLSELASAYQARVKGNSPEFAPHMHYFEAMRKDVATPDAQKYWRAQLRGASFDAPIPADTEITEIQERRDHQIGPAGTITTEFPVEILCKLKEKAKQAKCTRFVLAHNAVLLAAWSIGGVSDIILGSQTSRRLSPEVEHTIGVFTDAVPLRHRGFKNYSIDTLCTQTTKLVRDAVSNALPLATIMECDPNAGVQKRYPMYQIKTAYHRNNEMAGEFGASVNYQVRRPDRTSTHLDFEIEFIEQDGELYMELVYNRELFALKTAQHLAGEVGLALEFLLTRDISAPIADFHERAHINAE